jgi:hypothetical protein
MRGAVWVISEVDEEVNEEVDKEDDRPVVVWCDGQT